MTVRAWFYVAPGVFNGPFTAEDRAQIEATRKPGVDIRWVEATPEDVRLAGMMADDEDDV